MLSESLLLINSLQSLIAMLANNYLFQITGSVVTYLLVALQFKISKEDVAEVESTTPAVH